MTYWSDMDFTKFNVGYDRHKYCPYVAGFDTETTTIVHEGQKIAFMYVWQMAIENEAFYGRTWEEFRQCLQKIKNEMHLAVDYKLVVYVHNLKYDFGFYKREVNLEGKLIARNKRTVLQHVMSDCFEVRDSAVYTEEPLDDMGEEIGIPKLKGYDYSKIRHAETPLTADELLYCEHDVLILTKFFRLEAERYGCQIHQLALTVTQNVKRVINSEFARESRTYQSMLLSKQLKDTPKDNAILKLLKHAFFGAFNYSSILLRGKEQTDITGIDISACYGAQCLLHLYPVRKFEELELPESLDDLKTNPRYKGKAMLITFAAKKISPRYADIGFLPIHLHNYWQRSATDMCNIAAKRLLTAEKIEMTLTDVDFKMFLMLYKTEGIKILSIMGSDYGQMPNYMIRAITRMHREKLRVQAKNRKIRETRPLTIAEQLEYTHAKVGVSRVYGILVQDPIRDAYKWDADTGNVVKDGEVKNKVQFQPVLYQWGVWVVAWARYEILNILLRLAMTSGGFDETKTIYSDTDSLYFNSAVTDMDIISKYNARITAKVTKVATMYHINPADLAGIGTLKVTHYDKFKTINIKQYCFVQGDTFDYRCAGLARPDYVYDDKGNQMYNADGTPVNDGMTFFDNFGSNVERMAAFNRELSIPVSDAHVKRNYYHDKGLTKPITVTDYKGKVMELQPKSWVIIDSTGFDFDRNIFDTVKQVDKDRFEEIVKKHL